MSASKQNGSARVVSASVAAWSGRLFAALCLVALAAGAARATSYTYVGTAPANQNDWFDARNWSPNGVPGKDDDATIDSDMAMANPILKGSSVTVNNLTLKKGGSITNGNVVDVLGMLTMAGGKFSKSTVIVRGGMSLSGAPGFGEATFEGCTVTNGSDSTAKSSSGGIAFTTSGSVQTVFLNNGTFILGGTARILRQGQTDVSVFVNNGVFRVADPNLFNAPVVTAVNKVDKVFSNQSAGLVEVVDGTLTFDGPAENSGTFNTGLDTAVIKVASTGSLKLNDSARVTGQGFIEVNGGCTFFADVSVVKLRLKSAGGAAQLSSLDGKLSVETFEWQGGTISGPGATGPMITIQQTLKISGVNELSKTTFTNLGTADVASGARITGDACVFNNGGRINLNGGQLVGRPFDNVKSVFNNKAGAVVSNVSGQSTLGWDLNSAGSVEARQGTLTLSGAVKSSATFTTAADSAIDFFNNDAEFGDGTKLEGDGVFRGSGSGTINLSGTGIPISRFELNGINKTITGQGTGTVKVSFTWTVGNFSGSSSFDIDAGALLNINGDGSKSTSQRTINNSGTANITTTARFTLNDGAVWNNLPGSTLNLNSPTNQGFFYESGALPTFNNAGTVNVSGGANSPIFMFPTYVQTGGETHVDTNKTFDLFKGGTFQGGLFTAANNSTLQSETSFPINLQGGQVTTSSMFTINSPSGVRNNGATITPGDAQTGVLVINSDLNEVGGGVLNFDIGGANPGTQYDQVNVGGNAALGGTATIDLINGFVPSPGSTFQLMPYGSHTGTFVRINLPDIGSDRALIPVYGNTSFSVTTSPVNTALSPPVINSAITNASGTTVQGTYKGEANTNYLISIHTNRSSSAPTCEGAKESYVGAVLVTTNASGVANFTVTLPSATAIPVGQFVVARATGGSINLSTNFSACAQVTAGGSAVQYSVASYSVGEGEGRVTVTVTRTGDTTGTATVDYTTVDDPAAVRCDDTTTKPGVAFARCDYATRLDTITFAPGETQKSFTISIVDDAHVEGAETFSVMLRNPTGAILGAPSTATVMIIDNDAAGQPNPIFQSPFFVRQQYLDFLSREPDAGGFNAYLNLLNNCPDVNNLDPNAPSAACDRITVSAAFFGSQEFQLKGFFVFRFYRVAFDRLPKYAEIVPDMSSVTGRTPAEVFAKKASFTDAFAQRQEFTNAYGGMTNAQYVAALLGRYSLSQITTLDPAQPDGTTKVTLTQADLISRLDANTLTRAQVLRALADSDQVFNLEFNRAFVAMQYYGYLRRTPDTPGFNAWLNYLTTHPDDPRTMVNGFMNSIEFRLRFGVGQ